MIVGCCLDFGWIGGVSLNFLQQNFVNVMSELVTVEPNVKSSARYLISIRTRIGECVEIIRNDGVELRVSTPAYSADCIRQFKRDGWEEIQDNDELIDYWRGRIRRSVLTKQHDLCQVKEELTQLQIDEDCLSDTIARYSCPRKTKQTPKEKLLSTMNRDNAAHPLPKTDKHWFSKTGKTEFEDVLVRYRLK